MHNDREQREERNLEENARCRTFTGCTTQASYAKRVLETDLPVLTRFATRGSVYINVKMIQGGSESILAKRIGIWSLTARIPSLLPASPTAVGKSSHP